ncbi:MAG: very short patch repair endonuclease [Actinobacteria bacterium]|nr:very short patch repair endonuclease [Actinomycetota bacterium]
MIRLKKSKKEIISYKMSRVRSKGSEIEKIMGSALWVSGLRGYRKNQKGVLGTPDFCWKRQKIAVFCDSSFWHGFNWSEEKKKIKVRKDFWYKKIEDNMRRDKVITLRLRQDGWKVFRFWDFEIKKDVSSCVAKITRVLL